jgi:hypothetical protein
MAMKHHCFFDHVYLDLKSSYGQKTEKILDHFSNKAHIYFYSPTNF